MNANVSVVMTEKDNVFITLGQEKQFEKGSRPGKKLFERLDQLQIKSVNFQPQVLKGQQEIAGAIGECRYSADVHVLTAYDKSISISAHHTVNVVVTSHSLDIPLSQSTVYGCVYVLGEVVLQQLYSLQHRLSQRESVRLRGRDVKIRSRYWGFWDVVKEQPLQLDMLLFLLLLLQFLHFLLPVYL